MPLFDVVVEERTILTYRIAADSPEEAERIWEERDDQRGEPEEEIEGHELIEVREVGNG